MRRSVTRPEVLVVTQTRREREGQLGWRGKDKFTCILDIESLGLDCGLDMGDEEETGVK